MQCWEDTYNILSIDGHGPNGADSVDGVNAGPLKVVWFLLTIDEEMVDVINLQSDLGACKVYIKPHEHHQKLRIISIRGKKTAIKIWDTPLKMQA